MRIEEDLIDFNLPESENTIITVIGVGGGGNNAVNRMHKQGIRDVDFFIANTDAQALAMSDIPLKIQLGDTLTEGRGAGNRSEIGKQAAIESSEKIKACIKPSTKMAFIVAGMGGGTGTGATPVIARICRDMNILTVAVVTLPFRFEGPLRMKQAISGINTLKNEVDALLIIHNEKLREIYGNLTLSNAFANADNVLNLAVKGIAEIITIHGYVNVDFADVFSVMSGGGIAFMGSASAGGPDRAKEVIKNAVNSPLLNNNDIRGAGRVLLNITSGSEEITVDEIGSITDKIIENVQGKVNTIWGTCTDETLGDEIRITLVATGFSEDSIPEFLEQNPPVKRVVDLPENVNDSLFPEEPELKNPKIEDVEEKDDVKLEKDQGIELDIFDEVERVDELSKVEEVEEVKEVEEVAEEPKLEDIRPKKVEPSPSLDLSDLIIENQFNVKVEEDQPDEIQSQEKINSARLKALNYNNIFDPDNVDNIERVPAYKRKKEAVQSEMFSKDESESRYTIGSKDNRLRANNSYLHDVVD